MIQFEENIAGMLRGSLELYANQIAYTCMKVDLSYAELDERSESVAAWLIEHPDLARGDRIAIQLPNILQYPIVALGILKAGMVMVSINPVYTPPEIEHQLKDSGAKVLFAFANTASNAAKVIRNTQVKTVVVTEFGDMHSGLKRPLINIYIRYIKRALLPFSFPVQVSYREMLAQGERAKPQVNNALNALVAEGASKQRLDNLAVLQYTGGTTGVAKGAMLSERNLLSNMYQLSHLLGKQYPKPSSIVVAPLPLYHIYAFTVNLLFSIHSGMHNILIPDPRDISGLISNLKGIQFNVFVGINTLYRALCSNKKFSKMDFSKLSISTSAGMALSPTLAKRWFEITGCKIMEGYGLSEASPIVSINTEPSSHEGSVGQVCIETEIKLVDTNGEEIARNERGEVFIKGPQVMQGYWQKEEETKMVLDSEGWLCTGDIGVLDNESYLRIVDRVKDIIIVSGFNIYPTEIEDCICTHPAVVEAAAIGVSDGDVNEKVKLVLVVNNSEFTEKEVLAYCRQYLVAYKIPKIIEFRKFLPKSSVGKVLKRELR